MGSINILKPLSAGLSNAVNKSRQHQESRINLVDKFWECQESSPKQLGEKRKPNLCAVPQTMTNLDLKTLIPQENLPRSQEISPKIKNRA